VRRICSAHLMSLILAMVCAESASAQTQRSGGGEAQKFMQQYQQLAAERTSLQADNARLKKDLDAAKADLAAAKKERDAARAGVGSQIAQAKSSQDTAEKGLEQTKQRFAELVGRFREMAQNLKDVEADRGKARSDLAERNRAFDVCAENNQQLFEINQDVLNRYEHTGLFTRVSASEPFTRITRTRLENLVDETRERAEQLRIKKREADAASAAAADPAAAARKTPVNPK
jgi:chromosome segregation ATPase